MKVRLLLGAVPVFLAALVLGAPAAHAAGHDGTCNNNELCVYKDPHFGGGILDFPAGMNIGFYGQYNYLRCDVDCNAHDSISSLRVNGTRDVRVYHDINCASNSAHLTQDGPGFRENLALDKWDDGSGGVDNQIDSACWI